MGDADGAGVVEVAFFCGEEAFVGVDGLAGRAGRELLVIPSMRHVKASRMVSSVMDWRMRRGVQPVRSLAVPLSRCLTVLVRSSGSMMRLG